jgi:hypothetical protein
MAERFDAIVIGAGEAGAVVTPAPDGPASTPPPVEEPVSFHSPACGADFETQEHLVEIAR